MVPTLSPCITILSFLTHNINILSNNLGKIRIFKRKITILVIVL